MSWPKLLALSFFIFLNSAHVFSQVRYWIATSAGNWNNTANWSAASGGAGGASVPSGAGMSAVFNGVGGRNGNCSLDIAPSLDGITMNGYTGSIDLQGNNLTSTGTASCSFQTGQFINTGGAASVIVSTTATTTFSGTAFGTGASPNVKASITSGRVFLNGSAFRSQADFVKTTAVNDGGLGGNAFYGPVSITNNANASLATGSASPDTFNNTLTLLNTGNNAIRLAEGVSGNVFNGNIIVNNTNAGASSGILFGQGTGLGAVVGTIADAVTITVGASGFSGGRLRLQCLQFGTTSGAVAQTLTLSGSAILRLGPTSTFNGNVIFSAPGVELHGATYNGTASITKTGSSSDAGNGGNTFNQTTAVSNTGTGALSTGMGGVTATTADVYNAITTITNSNSGSISIADTYSATFNDNIIVNSSCCSTSNGIFFGNNNGATTLANNKTITTGTGLSSGELRLKNFTQNGSTAQSLTLTGTSLLTLGPSSTFNGNVNFVSPQVMLNGTTFNGTSYIEKNGATDNSNIGGNVFNASASLNSNNSGATWYLSTTNADSYNADVTFTLSGGGAIMPAYNGTNSFTNGITVNSSSSITFGAGNGVVQFTGGNPQSVSRTGSSSPIFQQMQVNKSANSVTLNTPVTVGSGGAGSANFINGIIYSTSTNPLTFVSGATATGASNNSFVDGPVIKSGTQAFTFPVGNNSIYRSIAISVPAPLVSNTFTAQYFRQTQAYGTTLASTLVRLSGCEYWVLDHTAGGSSASVTLSWNSPDCPFDAYITSLADLRVSQWNGAQWADYGNNGSPTGNATTGTVTSSAPVPSASFGPFTLASITTLNPLPVELVSFEAKPESGGIYFEWLTASEYNADYYSIEKSLDGETFSSIAIIKAFGTSNISRKYSFKEIGSCFEKAFYRLREIDLDGNDHNSEVITVSRACKAEKNFVVYPNPVQKGELIFFDRVMDILVINNLGEVVWKADQVDQLLLPNLESGLYILINSASQRAKLVVN